MRSYHKVVVLKLPLDLISFFLDKEQRLSILYILNLVQYTQKKCMLDTIYIYFLKWSRMYNIQYTNVYWMHYIIYKYITYCPPLIWILFVIFIEFKDVIPWYSVIIEHFPSDKEYFLKNQIWTVYNKVEGLFWVLFIYFLNHI